MDQDLISVLLHILTVPRSSERQVECTIAECLDL